MSSRDVDTHNENTFLFQLYNQYIPGEFGHHNFLMGKLHERLLLSLDLCAYRLLLLSVKNLHKKAFECLIAVVIRNYPGTY